MKYAHYIVTLLTLLVAFPAAEISYAKPKQDKSVPCPRVVADKEAGTYAVTTAKPKLNQYQCFRNGTDARKTGYLGARNLKNINFTGWYRVKITRELRNTCDSLSTGSGTLFLQVRENESGVFGEFCPHIGRYTGYRTDNGLIISGSEVIGSSSVANLCSTGQLEKTEHVELERVVDGTAAFVAHYRLQYRCLDPASGGTSCSKDYSGIAFRETHPIWPPASENTADMVGGCEQALTRCADCHEVLKDFPH